MHEQLHSWRYKNCTAHHWTHYQVLLHPFPHFLPFSLSLSLSKSAKCCCILFCLWSEARRCVDLTFKTTFLFCKYYGHGAFTDYSAWLGFWHFVFASPEWKIAKKIPFFTFLYVCIMLLLTSLLWSDWHAEFLILRCLTSFLLWSLGPGGTIQRALSFRDFAWSPPGCKFTNSVFPSVKEQKTFVVIGADFVITSMWCYGTINLNNPKCPSFQWILNPNYLTRQMDKAVIPSQPCLLLFNFTSLQTELSERLFILFWIMVWNELNLILCSMFYVKLGNLPHTNWAYRLNDYWLCGTI